MIRLIGCAIEETEDTTSAVIEYRGVAHRRFNIFVIGCRSHSPGRMLKISGIYPSHGVDASDVSAGSL